jgi:uncharacterized protein YrrD
MASQPTLVKHSNFIHRLVIERKTMETVGRVEVLWMYPPAHKVLGFVCKSGLLGTQKTAFTLRQIHALGQSSILVGSAGQETDGDRVSQLESLVGCEVWSDAGGKAGKIVDYLFDLKTGEVSAYLLTEGRLAVFTEGILQLAPSQILKIGRSRVLISDAIARSLVPYQPGVRQRLVEVGEKVSETLIEEYQEVTDKTQTIAQQTRQRLQGLAAQAKATVLHLGEQFLESTQSLTEQAAEKSHSWVDEVRHQAEQVGEHWQTLVAESLSYPAVEASAKEDAEPLTADTLPDLESVWEHLAEPVSVPLSPPVAEPSVSAPFPPPPVTAEPLHQATPTEDDPWADWSEVSEPEPATTLETVRGASSGTEVSPLEAPVDSLDWDIEVPPEGDTLPKLTTPLIDQQEDIWGDPVDG